MAGLAAVVAVGVCAGALDDFRANAGGERMATVSVSAKNANASFTLNPLIAMRGEAKMIWRMPCGQ